MKSMLGAHVTLCCCLFLICDKIRIVMLTCPCKVGLLTPHFYIVKLGFKGKTLFANFALKHRLLVHILLCTCTQNLCFGQVRSGY